ncbi:hypothetical protein [Gilvimarinus chinensis]|uniref:hypothetical protein n=1 Tax=Gilvimarinus chinensis TaxID=396005 RepID=UPI00035DB84F|nr:hypothetical protein [Gilvimarinus chinensis]
MARIRTIKPEFFLDERLYDLEEETDLPVRLAFAGLWTQCDREGRFEWRPRRLKAAILPYDSVDFSRVLDALTTRGFVKKYRVCGREYGVVPGFTAHQVINNRESDSTIPDPALADDQTSNDEGSTRDPRVNDACSTPLKHAQAEGKGKEGKGNNKNPSGDGEKKSKSGSKKHTYPEWFEELWSLFPPRSGSSDKRKAYHAANARTGDGFTFEAMRAATIRYAKYIVATGKQNSQFVMQAATFYGPGGHLENPWSIPNATHQQPFTGGRQSAVHRIDQQCEDEFAQLANEEAGNRDVAAHEPAVWPPMVEPGGRR